MPQLNTKIIATIGPATLDFAVFEKLIAAGVDMIRINTSYGHEDQYNQILGNVKKITNKKVEILLDIKKLEILDYASKNGIRNIALSFAETAEYVQQVRDRLPGAFIVSKIESSNGVKNFDQILEASDGIMVARGDLAEAETPEKVPPLQKQFTHKTLRARKFLVTATEMLLSMTKNPQPTKAEVSDVANAVFDNTSAVMLSEETAIGNYPVETVEMMRKIIVEAEAYNQKF